MKNRLQLRYHIPVSIPTRDGAMEYLKEAFHNGFKNTENNASLPAEPLVILYNDNKLDLDNGITEAKRLETSNVMLAIGRGGDGVNKENNVDYFVIDFAKHSEDILTLFNKIKTEENRAIETESDLYAQITNLQNEDVKINTKINEETSRAKSVEDELRTLIINEINRSEEKDSEITLNLTSEITRALKAEEVLGETISEEIRRSTEKDTFLSDMLNVANENISKLQKQANENTESLKIENINRVNSVNSLDSKFTSLISSEESERKTSDDAMLKKINENKVSSNSKTIVVTSQNDLGTNIEVNIDNKTIVANNSGILSVASDALAQYNGSNAISISEINGGSKTISLNINENDKILTNDDNGLLTTLSLKWVKTSNNDQKDEIQLIGKNDNVISRIEVADFIKDGMLDGVKLDTTDASNPILVFTFNSIAGKEVLNVNVKDLVDVYYPGNGISKIENTFSINVDEQSESFLTVSSNGLKLQGVQNSIDVAKNEISTKLDSEVNNRISEIERVETEYKAYNNNIINDYKNADSLIRTEFANADELILTTAKTYADTVTSYERDRSQLAEQELLNKINNNNQLLSIIKSNVSTDGSVMHSIFDSAIGAIVDTTTQNTESSLLKKFVLDGKPYFYVSNKTSDLLHNSKKLDFVIDTIENNINAQNVNINSKFETVEKNITNAFDELNSYVTELQNTIKNLRTEIDTLTSEINNLKITSVTEIKGTENEIQINRNGNLATIGFANDAYFVAGKLD